MAEVAVKADSFPAGPLEDIIEPKTFEMRYLGRARHLRNTLGTGLRFQLENLDRSACDNPHLPRRSFGSVCRQVTMKPVIRVQAEAESLLPV
jgi:hypothetical protein